MILYENLIQGTPEWRKARAGIATASKFGDIITAKTLVLSKSADDYENSLVAERLIGEPIEDFMGNMWTERGKELEGDAFDLYNLLTKGTQVRHVGFMTNDQKTFGASPDALAGDEGGVELKCPKAKTHISYLLSPTGAYDDYKPQVQGNLLVSGYKWWDVMSYHPKLPPSIYRAYPDLEYQSKLLAALNQMEQNIQLKIKQITGE